MTGSGNPITVDGVIRLHASHGIDLMKTVSDILRDSEKSENPSLVWNKWLMSVDGLKTIRHFYGDDLGGLKYVQACGRFIQDIVDFFGFAIQPVDMNEKQQQGITSETGT